MNKIPVVQLNQQGMVNASISSIRFLTIRVKWSKFKLRVSKLAKQNSHVHTLYHRWNSYIIGAISSKPGLPGLLHFLYASLELLMTYNIGHTWKNEAVELNTLTMKSDKWTNHILLQVLPLFNRCNYQN